VARRSPRYQFTDKAERDLEGIIDYTVQEWGVSQANTYLDGLAWNRAHNSLLKIQTLERHARHSLRGYSASLTKAIFCITKNTPETL